MARKDIWGLLAVTTSLKASNPGRYDHFGEGGSLDGPSGNSLVLGDQADNSLDESGAAYLFTR